MTDQPVALDFLASVPTFTSFAQIADPTLYRPIPDPWVLGLADVVRSTAAIEEGRYKAVNMAGAAVISALSNAVGHGAFPFVFGGDGASFAVPPEWSDAARTALAATATFAKEELGLELRIGTVPVRSVREAGHDLTLARFQVSPDVAYAMFAGGGLAWAEERLKAGDFDIAPAGPGTRPDLSGLSCRFDEIPAQRGVILSVIVRPSGSGDPAGYREVLEEVVGLVERSSGMAQPVPAAGPPLGWPPPGLGLEARASRTPGHSLRLRWAALLARTAASYLILRLGIPVGGFNPRRYMGELVANSDYRKYDDGLRMTIDCAPDLADRLEALLARASEAGLVTYGLHRQGAALMTCFTPAATRNDHIHFVDGAAGGYAAASSLLKAGEVQ